ncbi:cell division regulator GpsB [Lentilactobacillus laojiaonis]|uniref:cell division regulator GpsB n=1 Tax=Lentilactobacillus laojiaonis TaxID=2883998 RepID=UPI001D0B4EC5|nr:cell division regulator GpsB [Lentilactobacillus laojiaonis]UDM32725.1 cell division regulator GpsB [Lentilactobacillus laojiaonis]
MENVNYTPQDILQKEFRQKMRGYDPNDVDGFLDNVIKDYETLGKEVQSLSEENERLRMQVDDLTKQVSVGRSQPISSTSRQSVQPMSSATNMDILKRLSNLERRVFGSQDMNSNDSHRL